MYLIHNIAPHRNFSSFQGLIGTFRKSTRPLCISRRITFSLSPERGSFRPQFGPSTHLREMRIATLQFAPRLGDVPGNIKRANRLLKLDSQSIERGTTDDDPGIEELRPDILVLPEMAFSGYNFPSLEAIRPFLEVQGGGPSAQWAVTTAQRLGCKVCVGYPEIDEADQRYYNSLLVVERTGKVVHNYRKRFLYYTDETWASEGDAGRGFSSLEFDSVTDMDVPESTTHRVPTTFGICMDINPYKFQAPFTDWEFANRVLQSRSQLVILSTAWLTVDGRELLSTSSQQPDMETFNYWIQRFWPLLERRMTHEGTVDGSVSPFEKSIVIVFANRTGVEEGTGGSNPTAIYAGTSTIVAISQKLGSNTTRDSSGDTSSKPRDVKIHCWEIKGAREEGICFADTLSDPKMTFIAVNRSVEDNDDS